MEYNNTNIVSNLVWKFLERGGAQGVAFVVSIVLARILDPAVYGTVALVMVLTSILQVFVEGGLGNALIQKKDVDDVDFSTVFYTNTILCIAIYVIIYITAPLFASFYENSELVDIVRVLGVTVIISGTKNIQQVYVAKHMLFKRFFFSTLGGTILSAVVGIVIALNGGGVWALVFQSLVNNITDSLILWFTVKWRPIKAFSFDRLKNLYRYGWKLLVATLLDTVYANMYQLVIGKFYSPEALAYYNKADSFPNLIITNINTSIDSVLFPAMSQKQDRENGIKNMTRRAITTSEFVIMPIMIGFACVAEEFIELLLTAKWLPCVPFLFLFCIAYMFYPIHTANLNAIKAMGRSDLFLKLEIIKKIMGILVLIISAKQGVREMACAVMLMSIISIVINAWPNKVLIGYGWMEQIKDVMPTIVLVVIMAFFVNGVSIMNLSLIPTLIIKIVIGVMVYVLGAIIVRHEVFFYCIDMIKKWRKKG